MTYIFTGKLIKFGNFSCLPKDHVRKLTKEASIWSSFSGSVTKIISNRVSIPSIRGQRYFGPSQMNFFKLVIHSFSIIGVFRGAVIVRSILFLFIYLFFVYSSLSGSVTKVIADRVSVPSIRGQRYFGPSKMNLFNLLIHSFSIIAVFRVAVVIRSILFLFIYLFFVSNNLSVITLFPVLAILIFLLLIFKVSFRENIEELNSSLENIDSIDVLGNLNSR